MLSHPAQSLYILSLPSQPPHDPLTTSLRMEADLARMEIEKAVRESEKRIVEKLTASLEASEARIFAAIGNRPAAAAPVAAAPAPVTASAPAPAAAASAPAAPAPAPVVRQARTKKTPTATVATQGERNVTTMVRETPFLSVDLR